MADIFISYKRERRSAARHLEQILVRYGYSVWFDLALVRGDDYEGQIQRELNASKAVIVLWCRHSVQSASVRSEASRAKAHAKLIPLVIEPCELPLFSTLEQYIDLTSASGSPRDHALDPVLDDLERLVGREPRADLKKLREYEATWRAMTGGLSLAQLPMETIALIEAVVPLTTAPMSLPQTAPDYAFWQGEWATHRGSSDLRALKTIAEHAPPYFVALAKARIAEVEAEQELYGTTREATLVDLQTTTARAPTPNTESNQRGPRLDTEPGPSFLKMVADAPEGAEIVERLFGHRPADPWREASMARLSFLSGTARVREDRGRAEGDEILNAIRAGKITRKHILRKDFEEIDCYTLQHIHRNLQSERFTFHDFSASSYGDVRKALLQYSSGIPLF
jgi:hypothetical protein